MFSSKPSSTSFAPTTQHMDGNPHFEKAERFLEADDTAGAQVHATLALAFEQRSATLVELRKDKLGLIRSVQLIQDRILGGLALK